MMGDGGDDKRWWKIMGMVRNDWRRQDIVGDGDGGIWYNILRDDEGL